MDSIREIEQPDQQTAANQTAIEPTTDLRERQEKLQVAQQAELTPAKRSGDEGGGARRPGGLS